MDAVIFDMDGVLIDSEPLWQRAEMDVFAGVGLTLTEAMCMQTMGLRIDEVAAHWMARHPWQGPSPSDVSARILAAVCALIAERGQPMPHARASVEAVKRAGYHVGVASSSPLQVIHAVMERLELRALFDVVQSAQDEPYGKPHPAVYLKAAARLGVDPTRCVAVEDSINGILAAKSARMFCVAVPDHALRGDRRLGIADVVVDSLAELMAVLPR